jgi:hypothetical protein
MRRGRKASPAGKPPRAHVSNGLKEINFHVDNGSAIIGPRKFPRSKFFNRPVPNIHERGGTAVGTSFRRLFRAYYPERSFMWAAVKSLKAKNKIESRFNITLRSTL